MGSPSKQQGKLTEEEVDIKLTQRVAAVFMIIFEMFATLGKLCIAFVIAAIIGLAFVKSVELTNNAKMELDASVSIHQRIEH